jgi:Protein kinase domain
VSVFRTDRQAGRQTDALGAMGPGMHPSRDRQAREFCRQARNSRRGVTRLIAGPLPLGCLPTRIPAACRRIPAACRRIPAACPQIQAELGEMHLSVIHARAAILTQLHLCLVMEYAAGGALTAYVASKMAHARHLGIALSEDEARYFYRQLIEAVSYLHSNCVAHRCARVSVRLSGTCTPNCVCLSVSYLHSQLRVSVRLVPAHHLRRTVGARKRARVSVHPPPCTFMPSCATARCIGVCVSVRLAVAV